MAKTADDFCEEFLERFETFSDLEFIRAFNREVGGGGWGVARCGYFLAIRQEFKNRAIDNSSIYDNGISYRRRVSLYEMNGKKFVLPIE